MAPPSLAGRVLIAGGYGTVGSELTTLLAEQHPGVRVTVAGRNPDRGEPLARAHDNVEVVHADLAAGTFPDPAQFDVVVLAVPDPQDRLTVATLAAGGTVVLVAGLADLLAPPVALAGRHPGGRLVMAGHWQAGLVLHLALDAAALAGPLRGIAVVALFDPREAQGPAAGGDEDAFARPALVRRDGSWVAEPPEPARRALEADVTVAAAPLGALDVADLVAATDAADARFELATGDSAGTRAGGDPSHDVYVDLERRDGTMIRRRFSHPRGNAHMTGTGLLVAVEALLAAGDSVPHGYHGPGSIVEPAAGAARARSLGVEVADLD